MAGKSQIQSSSRASIGSAVIDNTGFGRTPVLAHGVASHLEVTIHPVTLTQNITIHPTSPVGYNQLLLQALTIQTSTTRPKILMLLEQRVTLHLASPSKVSTKLQQNFNINAILSQYPAVVEHFTVHDSIDAFTQYSIVQPDQGFSIQASLLASRRYRLTLDDGVRPSSSSATHTSYHWTFLDHIFISPLIDIGHNIVKTLTQSLTVTLAALDNYTWGRALIETFNVHAALSGFSKFAKSLTQAFKISSGFNTVRSLTLQQNIALSVSQIAGVGLKLLQKLQASSTSSQKLTYHFTLANRVVIDSLIDKLSSAILTQLFTVHPVSAYRFTTNNILAQLLSIHPALNNKLVLQIIGSIQLSQLSPDQLVSMIYRGDTALLDNIIINALYISPAGTTTTWVVNTRTNAVTEYLNYEFRSFAQLGNRYIAAGQDGLYELDGDTDDGASIIAEMMSGYLQLNEKKLFGIKGAYVAIRGGGRFYLKLITGDGRDYTYELKAQPNFMTTKVKVGKGISTTYMAFDLVTEGQDFDLDSLEFIPMTRGRRV